MREKSPIEIVQKFKEDFQLSFEELKKIEKFEPNNAEKFRKIAGRLDRIRTEMADIMPAGKSLRKWLFARSRRLGDSYFNLMVKGHFDKIIEDIMDIKG